MEDYTSAACRHFDDAYQLIDLERYDNAGYLAGYVVECALKVLVGAGGGISPKAWGHELDTMSIDVFHLVSILAPACRRYGCPRTPEIDALVTNWAPEMRYSATGKIDRATAELWLTAAEQLLCQVINETILDGKDSI